MLDYTEQLQRRGVLMTSSSLAHMNEGLRLQRRDGRRSVVDGPFAEAKEMVGGFFLLDVPTARGRAGAGRAVPRRRLGHGGGAGHRPLLPVVLIPRCRSGAASFVVSQGWHAPPGTEETAMNRTQDTRAPQPAGHAGSGRRAA